MTFASRPSPQRRAISCSASRKHCPEVRPRWARALNCCASRRGTASPGREARHGSARQVSPVPGSSPQAVPMSGSGSGLPLTPILRNLRSSRCLAEDFG
jgi:hypothetical protein